MTSIYITRHGQTVWNQEGRFQGSLDSPVTNDGIRRALALRTRLEQISFDAVYSSPSSRALQTADLISPLKTHEVIIDHGIREISFGDWEGKLLQDIEARYNQQYNYFWNEPYDYNPLSHRAESFESLFERVNSFINRLLVEQPSGNVLVITHAVTLKAILAIVKGLTIKDLWQPPFIHVTSLTIVNYDQGKYHMELEGDISHQSG